MATIAILNKNVNPHQVGSLAWIERNDANALQDIVDMILQGDEMTDWEVGDSPIKRALSDAREALVCLRTDSAH